MARKKSGKMALYLIPIGIAVNFVLGQIVQLLHLPLWCDHVGTMVVGALCGPAYSVITAFITGLLFSITLPSNLFYMGNYLVGGLLAGLLAKKGWFKKLPTVILFGLIAGVTIGFCGSLVTVLVYGGYTSSPTGVITGLIVKTFHLGLFAANTISEMGVDIIDKIPSAIITYLVVKFIPNRFLLKLPLGSLYIKNAPAADTEKNT